MKNWRHLFDWFQDMMMERKLLLVFLLLITAPLSFIGYFSYSHFSETLETNTIVYSNQLMGRMMDRMDDYIDDMVRISSIPAHVDDIKQNLIQSNRYYEQREQLEDIRYHDPLPENFDLLLFIQRSIERNISFINNVKRGETAVYIFDNYGNGFYSTNASGVRLNVKEYYAYWREKTDTSTGEALLFSTQQYTTSLQSKKYAFTVVRKIMDLSLSPIGLIAVDANISLIEDQVIELDKVTRGKSVIIDNEANVIYDSDKKLLSTNIADDSRVKKAVGDSGSFYDELNGEAYLNIYNTSSKTKWKVLVSIPTKELRKDTNIIRNVTWAATFITIAVALLISILLTFALTRPLRTMMRLMRRVQEGNLNVHFQVKRKDEIGQLGNQFNRMVLRINELIHDIYLMESKKKEAELNALQNQINPHFMYNTLESIRMMAELNDDERIADMISLLGQLLRYSISDLNTLVTVRQEIEHVQTYIEILNYRYPNRFELQIDLSDAMMDYPLIKLILQPIVENAIYHGLDEVTPMKIEILGQFEQNQLLLRIRDDGIGMEKSVMEKLNRTLHLGEGQMKDKGGIGLKNVNQRLKLQYGEASGLTVHSVMDEGTEVVLHLPVALEEGVRE
jgi:two-component system sensor histidine kinase YesM